MYAIFGNTYTKNFSLFICYSNVIEQPVIFYLINLATLVIRYVKSREYFKKETTIINTPCGELCQELCINNFISLTLSVPVLTSVYTDGLT